jgi:hypothetical protein
MCCRYAPAASALRLLNICLKGADARTEEKKMHIFDASPLVKEAPEAHRKSAALGEQFIRLHFKLSVLLQTLFARSASNGHVQSSCVLANLILNFGSCQVSSVSVRRLLIRRFVFWYAEHLAQYLDLRQTESVALPVQLNLIFLGFHGDGNHCMHIVRSILVLTWANVDLKLRTGDYIRWFQSMQILMNNRSFALTLPTDLSPRLRHVLAPVGEGATTTDTVETPSSRVEYR